jgi:tRNA G37 N-methylase TrmD
MNEERIYTHEEMNYDLTRPYDTQGHSSTPRILLRHGHPFTRTFRTTVMDGRTRTKRHDSLPTVDEQIPGLLRDYHPGTEGRRSISGVDARHTMG